MFWFFPPKMSKTHQRKDSLYFSNKCCWGKNQKHKGRMKLASYLLPYTEIYFKQTEKAAGGKQKEALYHTTQMRDFWAQLQLRRLYGKWSLMRQTSEQQRKRGQEIMYRMGGKILPVIHQYLDYTRNLKLNREVSQNPNQV